MCSLIFFMTISCRIVENREELIWRQLAVAIIANEYDADEEVPWDEVKLAIKPITTFPHDQIDQIKQYDLDEQCVFLVENWPNIIESLAVNNKIPKKLDHAFADLPFVVFGVRPEYEDYITMSRVLFIEDSVYAVLSASISEWTGSITLMRRTESAWKVEAECAEWTRF